MTSDDRRNKMIEAARYTALARELMERWKYEDNQATLHGKSNNTEADRAKAPAIRALANELHGEANALSEKADAIYRSLR